MGKITDQTVKILANAKGLNETDDKYAVLRYGVKALYMNIWKTIFVLIIGSLLGILWELIIFMSVFCLLRTFGCGLHMKNDFFCAAIGVATFLGGVYLAKITTIPLYALLTIFVIMFALYYFYAPAGTRYRPIGKSRIKTLKFLSLLCLTLSYIFAVTLGEGIVRSLIVYASVAQCLNVLPVTYWIFREGRPKDYEKG